MTTQTLALLLVAFAGSLLASTLLAIHGLVPASAALGIAQSGLMGAFALATPGRTLTLTPPGAPKP
jgi:hypothetical protein